MRFFAALSFLGFAAASLADGPADNRPENVRPIPPPGIAVPPAIKIELEIRLAELARRIAASVKALGVGRFDLIYSAGAQPVSARMRAVELYGSKVVPMVRDMLA